MTEMSPLRRRMIEDMTVRNLSPATQRSYVHAIAKFGRFFGRSPERLGGAPVPISLLRDLLSIGLWVVRDAMSRAWRACDPRRPTPDLVFLSFKTGCGLAAGSVGDIVQDGFRAIGVASSGHRLRAFFAEELALALLEERLALNGGVLDRHVEQWVLRRVADAIGNAWVGTTAAHYVERALGQLGSRGRR